MTPAEALLPIAVLAPLGAAALLTGLSHRLPARSGDVVASVTALGVMLLCGWLAQQVLLAPIEHWFGGWTPDASQRPGVVLGIGFRADFASAAIAAFCGLLFLSSFVFAWGHFDEAHAHFHVLMLLFLAAMTGFCLTHDLFNLFVWFELMSVAGFALTAYPLGQSSLEGAFNFTITNALAAGEQDLNDLPMSGAGHRYPEHPSLIDDRDSGAFLDRKLYMPSREGRCPPHEPGEEICVTRFESGQPVQPGGNLPHGRVSPSSQFRTIARARLRAARPAPMNSDPAASWLHNELLWRPLRNPGSSAFDASPTSGTDAMYIKNIAHRLRDATPVPQGSDNPRRDQPEFKHLPAPVPRPSMSETDLI